MGPIEIGGGLHWVGALDSDAGSSMFSSPPRQETACNSSLISGEKIAVGILGPSAQRAYSE